MRAEEHGELMFMRVTRVTTRRRQRLPYRCTGLRLTAKLDWVAVGSELYLGHLDLTVRLALFTFLTAKQRSGQMSARIKLLFPGPTSAVLPGAVTLSVLVQRCPIDKTVDFAQQHAPRAWPPLKARFDGSS